jgi:hypothetical protein
VAVLVVALVAAGGWWLTRDPNTDNDGNNADRPGAGATRTPTKKASGSARATPSDKGSSSAPPSSSAAEPSSASATPSASGTPSTADPGGTGADSPADSPAALVADYYELLPEDTDAAWAMLTPELQDEIGEDSFRGFWATVDDLRVDDAEEVDDNLVQVTLTYTTNGSSEQETRELAVVPADDGYLIDADHGAV